jgi:hypothetical protein
LVSYAPTDNLEETPCQLPSAPATKTSPVNCAGVSVSALIRNANPRDIFLTWLISLPEGTNLVASARVQLAKLEEQRPLTPAGELLRELFVCQQGRNVPEPTSIKAAPVNMATSIPVFLGAYLQVIEADDGWMISMSEMRFAGPLFERRWKMAKGVFARAMAKLGARGEDFGAGKACLGVPVASRGRILEKIGKLDGRLASNLEAPLSPREVEGYLGISGRERLRWTKDGRLPPYTRRSSNRSSDKFSIPFYSADLVHRLRSSPFVFDQWRNDDRNARASQ